MISFKHLISLALGIGAFVATFYSSIKLMWFLSTPSKIKVQYTWVLNLMDNLSRLEVALLPITIDMILIILFILQHSIMRARVLKGFWAKIGLGTAERSLYNLSTAGMLIFLLKHWRTIPTFILWQIDVEAKPALWWTFVLIHGFAWTIIYGGSVLMDLPELIGLKQVYYDINKLLEPIAYKSTELRKLYGHVRHPSFVGLSTVLWCTNLMSLDRLLLAILWTTYMFVAWTTDKADVEYHKGQLFRKQTELRKVR